MFLVSALVALLLQTSSTASVDPTLKPFQTLETRVSGAMLANTAALDELLAKDFAFMASSRGGRPSC